MLHDRRIPENDMVRNRIKTPNKKGEITVTAFSRRIFHNSKFEPFIYIHKGFDCFNQTKISILGLGSKNNNSGEAEYCKKM